MNYSEPETQNCIGMMVGIIVIVVGFFGGFLLPLGIDDLPVFSMIFFMMVIPMVSALTGIAIILYSSKGTLKSILLL